MVGPEGQLPPFSAKRPESIESLIITGRRLRSYERQLGFKRSLFEGQNVLNFGCGGSNISGEVKRSGIHANSVVDLDLAFDPGIGPIQTLLRTVDSFTSDNSSLHQRLVEFKHTRGQLKGRRLIQADGRFLPFEDEKFDTTLALFSTYQIPGVDKFQVFGELLRISNALHCAPVAQYEYEILRRLAEEKGFEVIYSRDTDHTPHEQKINITNATDYATFIEKFPYETRVKNPPESGWLPRISVVSPKSVPFSPPAEPISSNLVVLKRR